MSHVTTQTDSVDQMWSQYASKALKSGCVLDNRLTLEQLSNYELERAQDWMNLLAGMLFAHKAEGNLLHLRS